MGKPLKVQVTNLMNTNLTSTLKTSLSSLALLSLQLNNGKDYLDYLKGFVIEAIRQIPEPSYNNVSVQKIILNEFGLRIPVATLAICLKRLQKEKIIERTKDGRQFQTLNLPTHSIAGDRETTRNKINEVINQLAGFVTQRYQQNWNEEETTATLTSFVRNHSIDFVRFSEFRSPLPELDAYSASKHFIVASFIQHCEQSQPGTFESIKTLVESHILANALLCPDLQENGTGFKGITFVLDTRLMLKAFDLEASIDTENINGLFETILKLRGTLCIFPETKNEVRSVLRNVIQNFQRGIAKGPVGEELRKRGRGISNVIFAETNLEENLKKLKISTLPSPAYNAQTYPFQIDEQALRSEIEEEFGHTTESAIRHDISVVRNICALRRGQRVSRIEECKFVFLTTNSALSRAAFNQQRAENGGWLFSTVITDYHLSHLAWLKSPMQSGDLARTEILSSCHAAMRPPQALWREYLTEADKLMAEGRVSEQDHEALRLSINAPEELMDVTQGEIEGITEANLRTILARLKQSYVAEKEEELQHERSAHEQTKRAFTDQEQVLATTQQQNTGFKERQHNLEEDNKRLKGEQDTTKQNEHQRVQRIEQVGQKLAKWSFICFGIICVLAFSGALYYKNWWFGVPFATLSLFSVWTGLSGKTVKKWVEKWVITQLSKLIKM